MRLERWRWIAGITGWLIFCISSSVGESVSLRENTEVNGEIVRLSDLLPANVPDRLRQTAEAIVIGRSPQLGSPRVLDAAKVTELLAGHEDLLAQLRIPDRITIRRAGYPVERKAILAAIARAGRQELLSADLPEKALEWPGEIVSLERDPLLEVSSMQWDARQRSVQVALHCVQRAACKKFLVRIREPRKPVLAAGLSTAANTPPSKPLLVARGDRATLVLDDAPIRIQVQVICLERGALGQSIRVLNPEDRRVLIAEVAGAGNLRAR